VVKDARVKATEILKTKVKQAIQSLVGAQNEIPKNE
jgi:hypothetical protein